MEFVKYVRKPFAVDAVEITAENISEVAKLVGELKTTEDGKSYIQVDRRLVPNVFKVFPGFWLTKMETPKGDNIRCYTKRVFESQFIENNPALNDLLSTDEDVSEVTADAE